MSNVFWAESIQVDEAAVLEQLESSLLQLLSALPLKQTLHSIAQPQSKAERYFDDLVDLHQQMQFMRPLEQIQSQAILEHFEPLNSIQVYLLPELFDFEALQQNLIDFLRTKTADLCSSVHQGLIQSSLQKTLPNSTNLFAKMARRLFTNAEPMAKPATFNGIVCHDQFEECTALASTVQQALDSGIMPNQMAVIYPAGSDYTSWLQDSFAQASIGVTNLPKVETQYDWIRCLLRELMVLQHEQFPPLTWNSVLSNPLMPWANAIVASRKEITV